MPDHLITLDKPAHYLALNAEMESQFGGAIDGTSGKDNEWVNVIFINEPTAQQLLDAQAVVDAHNPAFITADSYTIGNTAQDIATIVISIPRNVNNATEIIATIEGVNTSPLSVTNNEATFQINGLDLVDGDSIEIGVVGFVHDVISIEVVA